MANSRLISFILGISREYIDTFSKKYILELPEDLLSRDMPLMSNVTLKFRDKSLENMFERVRSAQLLKSTPSAMFFGTFLIIIFAVIDYWTLPKYIKELWSIRIIVVLWLLLSWKVIFTKIGKKYIQLIALGAVFIAGSSVNAMLLVSPIQGIHHYYVGVILVIVFSCQLLVIKPNNAALVSIGLLFEFITINIYTGLSLPILINNLWFLLAAAAISVFGRYISELYNRILFIQSLLLERDRRLMEINALHDHLTGLPNRLYFTKTFEKALLRAKRNEKLVALMFIDLDNFKPVNDKYGHDVGDKLLVEVGNLIKKSVRNVDNVGRVGGDEFLVFFEGVESQQQAGKIAKRIIAEIMEKVVILGENQNDNAMNISCSIGISIFPSTSRTVDELIKQADIAMYQAKQHGGGNFYYWEPLLSA